MNDYWNWETVTTLWTMRSSHESLVIQRNKHTGQFRKVRYQSDPGTGSDHIVIEPGQTVRGYSFTHEEAIEAQKRYARSLAGEARADG